MYIRINRVLEVVVVVRSDRQFGKLHRERAIVHFKELWRKL